MTGKEMLELAEKARQITSKIYDGNFSKRIKELYAIAIEKGHGTKFGWLEDPVERPDERDFESEDEYDEADDRYVEFRNCAIGFVYMDDHNFTVFNGFAFEIDEDGNVAFHQQKVQKMKVEVIFIRISGIALHLGLKVIGKGADIQFVELKANWVLNNNCLGSLRKLRIAP